MRYVEKPRHETVTPAAVDLLKEMREALEEETTLGGLRVRFISFKDRIDPLNETCRELTRNLYWSHKRRIMRDATEDV